MGTSTSAGPRDEFSQEAKRTLANRVSNRCSNPECRATTAGPQSDPNKAVNIGVAAHITAAAAGGPRYDEHLTPESRSSATNGIWLCQNCAKRIDNDAPRYSAELLRAWKLVSEAAADRSLGRSIPTDAGPRDAESPVERAVTAISGDAANLKKIVLSFMSNLGCHLAPIASTMHHFGNSNFDTFMSAIEDAKPLVHDFAKVASVSAEFNPGRGIPAIFQGFEYLVGQCRPQPGLGRWTQSFFDVGNFVCHEAFLQLVVALTSEENWNCLASIFETSVFRRDLGGSRPICYYDFVDDIVSIRQLPKPSNESWTSPHGELLRLRYESGMPCSFKQLVDADYLLYIVSEFRGQRWPPVTLPYLKEAPDFLVRCKSTAYLRNLLPLLGYDNIPIVREKYKVVYAPRIGPFDSIKYYLVEPDDLGKYP